MFKIDPGSIHHFLVASLVWESPETTHVALTSLTRWNRSFLQPVCQPNQVEGTFCVWYLSNIALCIWREPFWSTIYFISPLHQMQELITSFGWFNSGFASSRIFCFCLLPPTSSSSFSYIFFRRRQSTRMPLKYPPLHHGERPVWTNLCFFK